MLNDTIDRRAFVARSGAAIAATSVLGGLLASRARAEVPTGGLPSVDSVKAQKKELVDHDVLELAALLQAGEVASVAVTQAYLDRIAQLNGPLDTYGATSGIHAFLRVDSAAALAEAAAADARLAAARAGGDLAPLLCGVPVAYEDTFAVEGYAVTGGTSAFAGNRAARDAVAVERLRAMGTVQLGITVCTPFAARDGASTVRSPWDRTRSAGGGAEGTAAAPVARLVPAAVGRDTDGGVIVPASVVGASAIKPSLGLVPTAGVMPDVPGQDTVAPVAKSVRDASLLLNAMLGPDLDGDPVSAAAPATYPLVPIVPRAGDRPLAAVTIGIPRRDWFTHADVVQDGEPPSARWFPATKAAFDRFVAELEALGATVKEVDGVDLTDPAQNAYLGTPAQEVTTLAARGEVRYTQAVQAFAAGVPAEQAAALEAHYGAPTFAAALAREAGGTVGARVDAEQLRRDLAETHRQAVADAGVDFLLVVTVGGTVGGPGAELPPRRAALDAANVIGWPVVSFPIGADGDLPVSAAFWGPRFSDPEIVQAAIDYQSRHPEWHNRRPDATTR